MDERPVLKLLQQTRSVRTRERLLAATTRSLIERGYAGASTALVASAAGVSQGALFKHFPDKTALLGACMDEMLRGLITGFQRQMRGRRAGTVDERLRRGVEALWGVFRQPEMRAIFELYLAARTDVALEQALLPLLDAHREGILREAALLFPEVAEHAEFGEVVGAVVYAMQGAALELFAPNRGDDRRLRALFERMARHELARILEG